jgi:hypothetical protein
MMTIQSQVGTVILSFGTPILRRADRHWQHEDRAGLGDRASPSNLEARPAFGSMEGYDTSRRAARPFSFLSCRPEHDFDDEVGSPPCLHYRVRLFPAREREEGCSRMSGERRERRDLAGGVLHEYATAA